MAGAGEARAAPRPYGATDEASAGTDEAHRPSRGVLGVDRRADDRRGQDVDVAT